MANQANKKIAEDFLSAYKEHNWDAIGKLLHSNIEWTLPGEGMISGTAKGIDEVIERVKAIVNGGVVTKLHHILVGQNGLTLSLNNTGAAADGRVLNEELATVLTIQDGLIVKIDTYLSDVSMMEKYLIK
ncbi:nuclear transport factor 2 family protein [uncultured Clostridium sp.]|uniref:nuclear transport factor 2 family protein n=1 Tax=uncultured Clostridium sp. TaxID=59620 RepID=UPI0028E3D350|nr:nuclear transport factor 2 family protein [uncultured Clostridium sp.]